MYLKNLIEYNHYTIFDKQISKDALFEVGCSMKIGGSLVKGVFDIIDPSTFTLWELKWGKRNKEHILQLLSYAALHQNNLGRDKV